MSIRMRLEDEASTRWPLVCHWDGNCEPLPRRTIWAPSRNGSARRQRFLDGSAVAGFDFCGHIRRLCADIARRCRDLDHIDVSRMLFAVTQARTARVHGLQARVTPLRFRDGELLRRRRGVTYQVQRFIVGSRDILYLVTFCLPRFLDLDFDEKFVTLFHELYHISPLFDGDLRRHEGRYSIHSHSQRRYDEHMAHLARSYLSNGTDSALHSFLRFDFAQLQRRHGSVEGVFVPRPKIIPLPNGAASPVRP